MSVDNDNPDLLGSILDDGYELQNRSLLKSKVVDIKHDLDTDKKLIEFHDNWDLKILPELNKKHKVSAEQDEYSIARDPKNPNLFKIMLGQREVFSLTEKSCTFTDPLEKKLLKAYLAQEKNVVVVVDMCGSIAAAKTLLATAQEEPKHEVRFSQAAIDQIKKNAVAKSPDGKLSAEDQYFIEKLKVEPPEEADVKDTQFHLK